MQRSRGHDPAPSLHEAQERFRSAFDASRDAAAIVRAVTDMAHTLDFRVVAEGIENEAQADVVERLGCDLGHGFLFSRPLTPEQVPEGVRRLDAWLRAGGGTRAR